MAMIASASGDYLSDFEISDLTLDCNLQRAPDLFPEILGSGTVKADASGATLTSSAAFFTPEMLGRTIAFENNTTARIMAVTSGTTVTLDSSFTFSALTFKVLGLQTLDSAIKGERLTRADFTSRKKVARKAFGVRFAPRPVIVRV